MLFIVGVYFYRIMKNSEFYWIDILGYFFYLVNLMEIIKAIVDYL